MNAYADYLMIISLPADLVKEISRYKRASVNAIGHFEGMHSRAYIPVTHQVRCKPFLAQPAIIRMGQRLSTMPPVELYLNGFTNFSDDRSVRTIYAKIEMTERTENWFKLLTMQMGIKLQNFVPHITIARNIPVTPLFNTSALSQFPPDVVMHGTCVKGIAAVCLYCSIKQNINNVNQTKKYHHEYLNYNFRHNSRDSYPCFAGGFVCEKRICGAEPGNYRQKQPGGI